MTTTSRSFIRAHADRVSSSCRPRCRRRGRRSLAQQLDVLIYTDLGMEGFTWSLAFSRLAPVQAAMWGHPITSGLDTVDYYISSELAEAAEADANYTEKLVRLKNLPLYYLRPPPAPQRNRAYFNLPARRRARLRLPAGDVQAAPGVRLRPRRDPAA